MNAIRMHVLRSSSNGISMGHDILCATTYLPGTDRLASVASGDGAFSRAYSYDAAGCVTSIVSSASPVGSDRWADRTFSWNSLYQLVSVSTNGVPAESYTYDALGRRATTTTAEGTVRHVYDGIHCIADIGESNAVLRSYVWGPGIDNLLAVAVQSGGGASPPGEPCVYYALTDHQNTVHGFADTNGAVVVRYAYDAWGNLLSEECSVPALASNRYRFQGREYSAATGLVNFRARWYDPETGRWLSKDPIGLAGGLNLYVFCGNEPMEGIDPLGLSDATIGESGAYTYKKFPGDAHFGGDHVHVYDRKTGAFLGRLDMTGHVISGSVPKKGIARFLKLLKGGIFKAGRCAVKCVQVVFCAIPLTLELILEPTPCNADEDIILEMIRLQAIQAEASLDVNDNAQDMETDVLHTPLLIIR